MSFDFSVNGSDVATPRFTSERVTFSLKMLDRADADAADDDDVAPVALTRFQTFLMWKHLTWDKK